MDRGIIPQVVSWTISGNVFDDSYLIRLDMANVDLSERLKNEARRLGFNMVGVIAARPGRRLASYHAWIANKYHGEMAWMARPDRVQRRNDLTLILPGVENLVVVGLDYWPGELPDSVALDSSRGRISNYSWAQDYHTVMEPRLQELAAWIKTNTGREVETKVYIDTGAILERDHGEGACIGFTGKNTMLINPRRGSWFFLGEILTTASLKPDVIKQEMPSCGSCSRCLLACPTNAFPKPYILDARRCISYLTIELKGWIPRELRPLMGNWVYGCDVCQEACPFNRFATVSGEKVFQPIIWDRAAPRIIDLLALDEIGFLNLFVGSPVERIGRDRLVRNACIAAGNWGNAVSTVSLAALLQDPNPIVRGHAAWALGQLGGKDCMDALKLARVKEVDLEARMEIELALTQ